MTLRKILIIPLIVSLLFFLIFSQQIFFGFNEIIYSFIVPFLLISIIIQFVGHLIRTYKMKYLAAPTVSTTLLLQFKALSIGYLFNTLLPLRLGELIRAQVIAYTKAVSFGFSLVLIIFERVFDVLLLSVIGAVFVFLGIFPEATIPYLVAAGALGLIALTLVLMAWREYTPLMKLVKRASLLLNDSLKVKFRFKFWSIIYGLQQTIKPKRLVLYGILTIIMWVTYILSIYVFILSINGVNAQTSNLFAPFYAMSIPSGPANFGSFSQTHSVFTGPLPNSLQIFAVWMFLIIPMSVVGLINLVFLKVPIWRKFQRKSDVDVPDDKLSRKQDVSQDMAVFLDNYLDGNDLSRIVSKREQAGDLKLVKYFKGGSDAITILVSKQENNTVEKIIAVNLKDRLKAQYDWLVEYKDSNIVDVIGEETGDNYYSIELDYDKDNEMFFDFIHRSSLSESQKIIDEIWQTLNRTVHRKPQPISDKKAVETYLNRHFYDCLEKALGASEDLRAVIIKKTIQINGKQYLNAYTVIENIKKDRLIMKDLASYNSSGAVHGDIIVDNILVNKKTGNLTIIDPAPDGNIINGRVFDFGKSMQSFYCGYEFLFRANEPAILGEDGSIAFRDQRSLRYTELSEYIQNVVAPKYLSDGERKAMIFHAGILMIRRLKHQVYQDPRLTLAMYAAGVKALNDFYYLYQK